MHTGDTLAAIWKLTKHDAIAVADNLAEVGFFEKRGTANEPVFWVPSYIGMQSRRVQLHARLQIWTPPAPVLPSLRYPKSPIDKVELRH
jgi:hypothetical protein